MTTTITPTDHEKLLVSLETTIAKGTAATQKRAILLTEMHKSGASLQQLADILNVARRRNGIPPITRHGVFKMIHRAQP
ncbi:MAG: hypothetical protein EHM43_12555 [Ignavibacteriae bacterium]|nr:MAG: hypothetical protein EHM43_12555 [Ignavibacteriota bacterium]